MRRLLALSLALALLVCSVIAWAGTYLDRAGVLLGEAHREDEFLLAHLSDKELAEVTHALAEARVSAARKMGVPKEVGGVHPHLLMVLENAERAAAAAQEGDSEKFLHHLRVARDEEAAFRSLLKQQGLSLPDVK